MGEMMKEWLLAVAIGAVLVVTANAVAWILKMPAGEAMGAMALGVCGLLIMMKEDRQL